MLERILKISSIVYASLMVTALSHANATLVPAQPLQQNKSISLATLAENVLAFKDGFDYCNTTGFQSTYQLQHNVLRLDHHTLLSNITMPQHVGKTCQFNEPSPYFVFDSTIVN